MRIRIRECDYALFDGMAKEGVRVGYARSDKEQKVPYAEAFTKNGIWLLKEYLAEAKGKGSR